MGRLSDSNISLPVVMTATTGGTVPTPPADNPTAVLLADGTWGNVSKNIDGGHPSSTYLSTQLINGGTP